MPSQVSAVGAGTEPHSLQQDNKIIRRVSRAEIKNKPIGSTP